MQRCLKITNERIKDMSVKSPNINACGEHAKTFALSQQYNNISSVCLVHRENILVITLPVNVVAPNDAGPSAGWIQVQISSKLQVVNHFEQRFADATATFKMAD